MGVLPASFVNVHVLVLVNVPVNERLQERRFVNVNEYEQGSAS